MGAKGLVIAIDGPSGVGKGTVARQVAERLGYLYADSGAMYRAVALVAMEEGIATDDAEGLAACAARTRLDFEKTAEGVRVLANGRDLSEAIRTPEASQAASVIAVIPEVREHLVEQQQRIGAAGGVVMEGRDIGSVVFPRAEVKVFLDASVEERVRRRHQQETGQGIPITLEETRREIEARDRRDRERAASPLLQTLDAVYLDSTALTVDEVVEVILYLVKKAEAGKVGD
ncbi:MAG: (d)CMP kinase [Candidatus Acidiferrales bacterium]